MTTAEKETIRKLQNNLIRINNGERFFFNITEYQKLGLVYGRDKHGKDSSGNDIIIQTNWYLTEKAKQYIKVMV
jgi:hypothetical protein